MALRPFARNPKTDQAEETVDDQANEVDQFFSAERRRQKDEAAADDAQPEAVVEQPGPSVKDPGDPGWYPDSTTPGLMRYWDGFHLTGQVLHVHARAGDAEGRERTPAEVDADSDPITVARAATEAAKSSAAEDSESEPAASVDSLPALNKVGGEFLPPALTLVAPAPTDAPVLPESEAATDDSVEDEPVAGVEEEADEAGAEPEVAPVDEAEAVVVDEPEADEPEATSVDRPEEVAVDEPEVAPVDEAPVSVVGAPDTTGDDDDEGDTVDSRPEPTSVDGRPAFADAAGEAEKWAKEAEKAVARASSVGTPETWQEAARLAVIVSEMAQTLQAAAQATELAAQKADAARMAAQQSEAAAQRAADANQADQRAQRAAQDADDAAQRARRAAVEAKQAADRASQALPSFVETEKAAAQEAADAQKEARRLQEIVGKASKTDTASAWTEALKLSSADVA